MTSAHEKGGAAIRQSTLKDPAVLGGNNGADYYTTVEQILAMHHL